ncbi:MAG TPA: hypothetical protein DCO86_02535 [Spirochaetaceae bacterium]|nr:hypothetical protein [Spirochaetaceae bacterium]
MGRMIAGALSLFLFAVSCVSTRYEVDYSKSTSVSFDADLAKGHIWECIIEGENRERAELIAADYLNIGEGADVTGKYVFHIVPLKEGAVSIRYVCRNFLKNEILKDVTVGYAAVERFGRLVLEEM